MKEGENHIRVSAENRSGEGPLSNEITVNLDTAIPQSPSALSAAAKKDGIIKLSWQRPTDDLPAGYNLYRADNPFAAISEAVKVNTGLITGTSFDDLPLEDGIYYYRVTSMSAVDNESGLSDMVSAESDSTAPAALSIQYTPHGNYDPQTQRMAPGTVDILLTVSEALMTTPFLSITPEGGVPVSVALNKISDSSYSGFFIITDTTPTGTANVLFSGRDIVGNRSTQINSGASLKIDSSGPAISRLVINPEDPIKNNEQEPIEVTLTFGLNEEIKPGTSPSLSFQLSGQNREPVIIDFISLLETQNNDAQTWQAVFELPADAGLDEAETLRFIYNGSDDLDNISSSISADNSF